MGLEIRACLPLEVETQLEGFVPGESISSAKYQRLYVTQSRRIHSVFVFCTFLLLLSFWDVMMLLPFNSWQWMPQTKKRQCVEGRVVWLT
jgi:hypothetical protein